MRAAFRGVRRTGRRGISLLAAAGLLLLFAGCRQDMHVQPRYNPFDPTDFFEDGQSARMPVAGTVPRGELTTGPEEFLYTGNVNGVLADALPFPVSREVLDRGRERFDIYCSPCPGLSGQADGVVVQRR